MIGDQLVLKHHQTLDGSEVSFKGRITKVPGYHHLPLLFIFNLF